MASNSGLPQAPFAITSYLQLRVVHGYGVLFHNEKSDWMLEAEVPDEGVGFPRWDPCPHVIKRMNSGQESPTTHPDSIPPTLRTPHPAPLPMYLDPPN